MFDIDSGFPPLRRPADITESEQRPANEILAPNAWCGPWFCVAGVALIIDIDNRQSAAIQNQQP